MPSADRLLEAIRDDELSLDFQPVVTRHPRTLKKLDALVRWDHPALGRIPPGDVLPGAEANTAVINAAVKACPRIEPVGRLQCVTIHAGD